MRKTLSAITVAMCLFPAISDAQLRMAILGGPQTATVDETNSIPGWETSIKPGFTSRNGFHLGVMVEVPLSTNGKWFLQPGIMYSTKGREYYSKNSDDIASLTDTVSVSSRFYTNYIDIPLNFAYKLHLGGKTNFIVSAGPYMAFFYNGKRSAETRLLSSDKLKSQEETLEVGNSSGKISTLDLGFNARAGLEIGSILLTGFYSKGLNDFYQADYDGSFRHEVIGASLGFWLNKPSTKAPVKDKDKDGVPDIDDECPTLPGALLTHGCPDRDGDGVADVQDRCPEVAGLVSNNGCPFVDNDNDGIENSSDKCPDQPGTIAYQGCPVPDTDGDGIADDADSCKDIAGVARFNGCPVPDKDQDGINDLEDKCPDVAGLVSNNGCPEIKKEIIQQVNYTADKIFFLNNSDKLSAPSLKALDKLAILINSDPTLKLKISGHTDNTGNEQSNLALSMKRASAVSSYLVSKGISVERLQTEGFGANKPIESNETAAGREKNRRVELAVSNN
ncbi:MAG TPA: OmpA family protein [Flavitalea sp.]|nr:OmpA family protein [Flavitalea sp.]